MRLDFAIAAIILSAFIMLTLSKTMRSRLFAFLWTDLWGEEKIDRTLRDQKNVFIKKLALEGTVLDVGTGGGIQLKYLADCPKVTHIVCVEPNRYFRRTLDRRIAEVVSAREATKNTIEITVFDGTIEEYIQSSSAAPMQFDAITCLLVLCSIPTPLVNIRRLHDRCLKPGGKFAFIEHVAPEPRKSALLPCPVYECLLIGALCSGRRWRALHIFLTSSADLGSNRRRVSTLQTHG